MLLLLRVGFSKRDARDMLDVLLRDIGVAAATLHLEPVCAAFGAGTGTLACVADAGDGLTTVCCVQDGVCLSGTQVTLPFGGEDVAATLLWLLQRGQDSQDGSSTCTQLWASVAATLTRCVLRRSAVQKCCCWAA